MGKKPPEPLIGALLTCAVCEKFASSVCSACQNNGRGNIFVCGTECLKKHIKGHPQLTEVGCVTYKNTPDGQCSYCPAPVCNGLACENGCQGYSAEPCHDYCGKTCREVHEAKHFDDRSDKDKCQKGNP